MKNVGVPDAAQVGAVDVLGDAPAAMPTTSSGTCRRRARRLARADEIAGSSASWRSSSRSCICQNAPCAAAASDASAASCACGWTSVSGRWRQT